MLRKLQQHPLLAGVGEVLVDAVRYVAVMVVLASWRPFVVAMIGSRSGPPGRG